MTKVERMKKTINHSNCFNLVLVLSIIFFTLNSCFQSRNDEITKTTSVHIQPSLLAIESNTRYSINRESGEIIKPIINTLGDTIQTGVHLLVKPKRVHPDGVSKPKSFILNHTVIQTQNSHPNKRKLLNNISSFRLDNSKLSSNKLGSGNSNFTLIGEKGDTIITGSAIHTKGKKVKAIQPKPIKALPPAIKDAAICNMQYLDIDQGMYSSYVSAILEDSRGNLWFGTSGGGVSLYDGVSFTHFTKKEGLSNTIVWAIHEDKKGNIWFGTYGGGVCVYDGVAFTHFTEKEGLSNNVILAIAEDKYGNIWLGTSGGGASVLTQNSTTSFENVTITHYTEKEGLTSNLVLAIFEDEKGNIWLGTGGSGVCVIRSTDSTFNQAQISCFSKVEGLNKAYVSSVIQDNKGNVWLGTSGNGVYVFAHTNNSGFENVNYFHLQEKDGLSSNVVRSIKEDKKGNIWLGTSDGGVNQISFNTSIGFDDVYITHWSENEGLSNNTVRSIQVDKNGNIWFGTWGGGVTVYKEASFKHFTEKEGLSNNVILSVLEDKRGNLWFGSSGGGVNVYDGSRFSHLTQNEGLSNNLVWCALEDKKGNIWLGTYGGGISVITPKNKHNLEGAKITHITEKEGLSNNIVLSLLEDNNENIWIGTENGGITIIANSFSENLENLTLFKFSEDEGLSNNSVWSLFEDKNGYIYIGTRGAGVSILSPSINTDFKDSKIIHLSEKEGLSNSTIWAILEDKQEHIWLGTWGGGANIIRLNDSTGLINAQITYITEAEGLNNNSVYSIIEDKKGRVWLGTEKGLNIIQLSEANELNVAEFSVEYFNKGDGLKGQDFYINSAYIDSKNRAWWGTGKSLTQLNLNTFQPSSSPPQIQLTQLDINDNFIDYRTISDDLLNDIEYSGVHVFRNFPINLKLPFDINHLSFHYAAIDWSAPHKILYSYRMLGLDENWSLPTKETKADYRNMPHGTFTFMIRAIGESGEWSEPFEYTFTIHPPWYESSLYYILQTAFLLFLVLLALMLNRSKKGNEWVIVLSFVVLITIFEFFLILIEPYIDDFSSGIPVVKLVVNVGLALSLNPIEKLVRARLHKNQIR